jgi:hypothetical protein
MPNAYQTTILAESALIHYWELDETSGTSAADSKGAVAGTISTTAPAPTLGAAGIPAGGTSFLFNGDTSTHNSKVSMSSFLIGGTAGFAVECWIYFPANAGRNQHVFAFSDSGAGTFSGRIHVQSDDSLQCDVYDGANHTINSNGALSLTTWHHIVLNAPKSGTMTLYVDGVAQTATAALGTPYNLANALPFWIGGGTTAWFDATFRIDEVAIYNAPLSAGSISSHYTAGTTAPSSSVTITTDPANNKTAVSRSANVRATFSAAMNASTINGSTFTMTQGGTGVTASVSYDASTRTAYLKSANRLGKNLVYVCTLSSSIQDGTNTPISTTTWQFTTRKSNRLKWYPRLGTRYVR